MWNTSGKPPSTKGTKTLKTYLNHFKPYVKVQKNQGNIPLFGSLQGSLGKNAAPTCRLFGTVPG
jgi:hypothetical protein